MAGRRTDTRFPQKSPGARERSPWGLTRGFLREGAVAGVRTSSGLSLVGSPVSCSPLPQDSGPLIARPGPTSALGAQASDTPDGLHRGWRVSPGTLDSCCGLFQGAVWAVTREHPRGLWP